MPGSWKVPGSVKGPAPLRHPCWRPSCSRKAREALKFLPWGSNGSNLVGGLDAMRSPILCCSSCQCPIKDYQSEPSVKSTWGLLQAPITLLLLLLLSGSCESPRALPRPSLGMGQRPMGHICNMPVAKAEHGQCCVPQAALLGAGHCD